MDRAFSQPDRFADNISVSERALIMFTLVPETASTSDKGMPQFERLKPRMESARAAASTSGMVASMPWLGWAEIALERDQRYVDTDWSKFPAGAWRNMDEAVKPRDLPSALALRHMRDQCWEHQLQITDADEDTLDMVGGIVLSSGVGKGGTPYPTWQCVRPLAFIATMLGDPRLTEPQERPAQIAHLMQAARFLRQLQVDESSAWMYPDPKLAFGGVRASTWDNSLPVDATSMTLLCVTELLKSLDELAKQPAPAPAQPPAR
jgi:hypothetical protein